MPEPLPRSVTELVPRELIDKVRQHLPADGYHSGTQWLLTLPQVVAELLRMWGLTVSGPARHGEAALVLPVAGSGEPAVLKVVWPHPEARDEHRALQIWGGVGAVRLLAADPGRWALLLERLDTRDLSGPPVTVLDSCAEIGHLAALLDRPAPPWALRASDHLEVLVARVDALRSSGADRALPRQLVDRGRALALELAHNSSGDARLVHGDLHQQNVLWRPADNAWVAIDPHAIAADRAWVVAPSLWNRWGEAVQAHDTRVHLNLRLEVLCEAGGIDPDLARAYSQVRILSNAVGDIAQQPADLSERLTRHVSISKALQGA